MKYSKDIAVQRLYQIIIQISLRQDINGRIAIRHYFSAAKASLVEVNKPPGVFNLIIKHWAFSFSAS